MIPSPKGRMSCGVRPGRTLEPSGSRWTPTERRRYVRRGTRTIALLAGVLANKLIGSKDVSPDEHRRKPGPSLERPRGRLEEIFLVGGERRFHGFLHRFDSTAERACVEAVRVRLVRQELVRDVQRGHDRDALVAHDLAGVAHLAQLAIEVVDGGEQLLLLAVGATHAELAPEQADGERALLARLGVAHVSVS